MHPSTCPAAELRIETATMRALLDVLEREQHCLSHGDADGCAALLEQKATSVSLLASLASDRHRRLAALGFSANEKGMTDWLRSATEASVADWAALMAVTREAHECHRLNGLLLGQLAARNRQALAAMGALEALGGRATGGGLYGPGGQTDYGSPRHARVIGVIG